MCESSGLIQFLRQHGIAFYAHSPLAGGFLTGKVTAAIDSKTEDEVLFRTKWRGESAHPVFVNTFDKPIMHDAIRRLRNVCERMGLAMEEVSLRWLMFHSELRESDAIILGGKTLDQISGNVDGVRKGALEDEDVLEVVEGLWGGV